MNKNGFIKIPNSVVGSLKKYHCSLYVYLLYLCTVQNTNTIKVKYDTCRKQIGAAFKGTVCDEMHYLQEKGYVKIENNYSLHGLQTCNTIIVNGFDPKQDYFLLPAEHMELQIPPAAFELMLCLYMFAYRDPYCFPSYTQIRNACHLGFTSIANGYKILEEKGVITKENYTRMDGSKGHNRYFLIKKIEKIVGEEKTVRFLAWIRKQKEICFELWQVIKEVLAGNTYILEEICKQEEACSAMSGTYCGPNDTSYGTINVPGETYDTSYGTAETPCTAEAPDTSQNLSIMGFLRKKISRIRGGIRHFFDKIHRNFRDVLLQD